MLPVRRRHVLFLCLQVDPDYRYIQVSVPHYENLQQEDGGSSCFSLPGTFQPEVRLNVKAREILVKEGVVVEGKLGCDRRGRFDYENQAGERGIIVLERSSNCPSDRFLAAIGYTAHNPAWLFVTRKEDQSSGSQESWKVPVMGVDEDIFKGLLSFVQNKFSIDCNALPPVYLKVANCSYVTDFRINLSVSSRVTRFSFDCIAHCPAFGKEHRGVSGKWTRRWDEHGSILKQLRVRHGGGGEFALLSGECGEEQLLGGGEGEDDAYTTQYYTLAIAEYERLASIVVDSDSSDATSCFIAVRYAAPLGSIRDRSFLRTPLQAVRTPSGEVVNRTLAQRILWKVLNLYSTSPPTTTTEDVTAPPPQSVPPPHGVTGGVDENDDSASVHDSDDSERSFGSDRTVHGDMMVVEEACSEEEQVGVPIYPELPVTMDEIKHGLLPCLPEQCGEGLVCSVVKAIVGRTAIPSQRGDVVMDPDSLLHIVELLKGLVSQSSVVVMIPYDCIGYLRDVLQFPNNMYMDSEARTNLEELCPEVYRVLMTTHNTCIFPQVCDFVEGLCCVVDEWVQCGIAPPEFQPVAGSYNPEVTGMAFRMMPSGERGRVIRRYVADVSAADTCNKKFTSVPGHTGGIFSFFCVVHGLALGTAMIPHAEGRRDPFWSVYLHSKDAPRKLVFDFACGLVEYALNREPIFWLRCRYPPFTIPIIIFFFFFFFF